MRPLYLIPAPRLSCGLFPVYLNFLKSPSSDKGATLEAGIHGPDRIRIDDSELTLRLLVQKVLKLLNPVGVPCALGILRITGTSSCLATIIISD